MILKDRILKKRGNETPFWSDLYPRNQGNGNVAGRFSTIGEMGLIRHPQRK